MSTERVEMTDKEIAEFDRQRMELALNFMEGICAPVPSPQEAPSEEQFYATMQNVADIVRDAAHVSGIRVDQAIKFLGCLGGRGMHVVIPDAGPTLSAEPAQPREIQCYDLVTVSAGHYGTDRVMEEDADGDWVKFADVAALPTIPAACGLCERVHVGVCAPTTHAIAAATDPEWLALVEASEKATQGEWSINSSNDFMAWPTLISIVSPEDEDNEVVFEHITDLDDALTRENQDFLVASVNYVRRRQIKERAQ